MNLRLDFRSTLQFKADILISGFGASLEKSCAVLVIELRTSLAIFFAQLSYSSFKLMNVQIMKVLSELIIHILILMYFFNKQLLSVFCQNKEW